MKQEQVIELAKKAGFFFHDAGHGPDVLHTLPREYSQKCFERLIAEVEQATLERAAQICDDKHSDWRFGDGPDANSGPKECAEEIRNLAKD